MTGRDNIKCHGYLSTPLVLDCAFSLLASVTFFISPLDELTWLSIVITVFKESLPSLGNQKLDGFSSLPSQEDGFNFATLLGGFVGIYVMNSNESECRIMMMCITLKIA